MEYQIYTKKQISSENYLLQSKDDLELIQFGKIDLNNLNESSFNPVLSEIPQCKMEELAQNGQTVFTVVTTQMILITK
ncbi:hypothetical protein [uncultured Chryseobacterium sp.]|uniref:hypothetical protein n=1 Tax=uncultured Chryseobacterium sp. TaxID=259322 RepID=UPI0025F2AC41|nr:hypothetical protein [uncultured Chryseobacterium sp.]